MKKFENIKLVASDLDGTLLNINGKLSKKSIETLYKLKKENYKIVIISGRPIYALSDEILNLDVDYIVCMNGQYILDKYNNKIIEKEQLNFDDIVFLNTLANKNFSITNIHTEKYTYLIMDKKFFIFGFIYDLINRLRFVVRQRNKTKVKYLTNINKIDIKNIAKMCFISTNKNLKSLEIEAINSKKYETFLVADNWLEIQPLNINKGSALKFICEKENIELSNTLVFGDGENDISMLKIAGISVVMENGMKKTKEYADYIADSFINDGVSKFVEKNLL